MITIIIPLLASTFIGIYAYNRYQGTYFDDYMADQKEETITKVHGYLQYTSSKYEKEPYYHQDVMKDNVRVMTIDVFRVLKKVTKTNDSGKEETVDELEYDIAIYNINYSKLVKYIKADKKLSINDLPIIYVKIKDINNSSVSEVLTSSAPDGYIFIDDYNASPDIDDYANDMGGKFLKWYTYTNDKFSEDVKFEIVLSDEPENEAEAAYYAIVDTFTKADFKKELKAEDTVNFTVGYESNIKKAGYFVYVLKTKIWWQSLVTFVIVGFISFSFYIVWTAEEELNRKKVKKAK
jgi:hypothetical protein